VRGPMGTEELSCSSFLFPMYDSGKQVTLLAGLVYTYIMYCTMYTYLLTYVRS
jgi:hypothetical protein